MPSFSFPSDCQVHESLSVIVCVAQRSVFSVCSVWDACGLEVSPEVLSLRSPFPVNSAPRPPA